MQVALCINNVPITPSSKTLSKKPVTNAPLASIKTKASSAAVSYDTSTFDYSSSAFSVFPVEACETIGGDACMANMYPEVKVKPESNRNKQPLIASETFDREYFEYNEAKTVFKGEACDDLGGMFCEREYQRGVY